MRVLFVETFYGGSHRSFADGLAAHSQHRIDLFTLPAERWRERIRTGAFEITRLLPDPAAYDVVVATDLINLGDLRALWSVGAGSPMPPVLLYMHETQATYPPPRTPSQRAVRDGLSRIQDLKNCLLAERVLFNSRYHREAFIAALPELARESGLGSGEEQVSRILRRVGDRSGVVYPGVATPAVVSRGEERREVAWRDEKRPEVAWRDEERPEVAWRDEKRPEVAWRDEEQRGVAPPPGEALPWAVRILWNHRREYDKRPRAFFGALRKLLREGVPFEVVVLGESPRGDSPALLRAREELGDRVLHWGYADSREEYFAWLHSCDIVVSTAIQENFGIALVEAISAGCVPLLPRRLSYPELIPEELHGHLLYEPDAAFAAKLRETILTLKDVRSACNERGLWASVDRFTWSRIAPELDREITALGESRNKTESSSNRG